MGKEKIMLKIKIPKFAYGKKTILENIDLSISTKKIHSITGDNGNGKSTFLHILSGAIKVNKNIEISHNFKTIMCAFQNPIILNRTVEGNLLHLGKILKIKNIDEQIKIALQEINLLHLKSQPAQSLSGGQKMRLQIARLIISDADLWILDEPFAGLDEKSCEALMNIIKKHNKKGATILIATHNNIIKNICDKNYLFVDKTIRIK